MSGTAGATVIYQDASGADWTFPYHAATHSYRSPPGLPWQLTASTSAYTLTDVLTGAVLTFNSAGALVSSSDSYGNTNTLNPTGGAATTLTNSGGRALTFVENTGQLTDVESPGVGSQTVAGQHVAYSYVPTTGCAAGQLCGTTWGYGTGDAVSATFAYSGTLLTGITTPSGNQWTLTYNA
jgi:hypothetical protein